MRTAKSFAPSNESFWRATHNREWLLASLKNAGRTAGCESWWLLEDVATAIWSNLSRENLQAVANLAAFDQMVKAVLSDIGYRDVAKAFCSENPTQQMSLLTCGQNPPLRDEHDFYVRLQKKIFRCHQCGVRHLHFTDLSAFGSELSKLDQTFGWWSPSFDRRNVISFVRRQFQILRWPSPVCCVIS